VVVSLSPVLVRESVSPVLKGVSALLFKHESLFSLANALFLKAKDLNNEEYTIPVSHFY
jgi:hypothetical protein